MKRRWTLLATLMTLAALLTGCLHQMVVQFGESFEQRLSQWQQGADVPEDPNAPGTPVAWFIEASADRAAEGNSSARFFLDGLQDDGTIWLARAFEVPADRTVFVSLSFQLWSVSESFNTLAKVAAYAGAARPEREGHFDTDRSANQAAGWESYAYEFAVESGPAGAVWIAFGISAVWETEMTYYVDDVDVTLAI